MIKKNTGGIRRAFTLAEVVIATSLGVIIFGVIFIFSFNMLDDITESRLKIAMYTDFDEFYNKFQTYSYTYNSGTILSTTLTGSNIMMTYDYDKTKGILFGNVNVDTLKLDIDGSVYKNTVLGFRKLSTSEISSILADNNSALDLLYYSDNLYTDLKVKDLFITSYNSGIINNYELIINTYFNHSLEGHSWDELPKEDLLKINFTF